MCAEEGWKKAGKIRLNKHIFIEETFNRLS